MSDDANNDIYSRRGFLGMGSAALAAAGLVSATDAASQEQRPYPTKSDRSASAPGPTNPPLDTQNPDSNLPPPTDAGGVQTFKYPFALSHKRMQEGGWSREVTVRELPVSKVNRRRGHETDRGRRTRAALAHRCGVGVHAVRKRAHHGD